VICPPVLSYSGASRGTRRKLEKPKCSHDLHKTHNDFTLNLLRSPEVAEIVGSRPIPSSLPSNPASMSARAPHEFLRRPWKSLLHGQKREHQPTTSGVLVQTVKLRGGGAERTLVGGRLTNRRRGKVVKPAKPSTRLGLSQCTAPTTSVFLLFPPSSPGQTRWARRNFGICHISSPFPLAIETETARRLPFLSRCFLNACHRRQFRAGLGEMQTPRQIAGAAVLERLLFRRDL
jgi:hypothetical protein